MEIYGEQIQKLLDRWGVEYPPPLLIPGGERSKSQQTADLIHDYMDQWGVSRFGEPPIIIGGSVLHDVGGYAAGTYRRGIDYHYITTTLVGLVDAAWALKVAISAGYKNRKGLYHPAKLSAGDLAFLSTLPDDEILEGVAEIVKWAFAGDGQLVRILEEHGPRVIQQRFQGGDAAARAIVQRTIAGMLHELTDNPWEHNPVRRSYWGHSLSPALEPTLRHGQAVSLDGLISIHVAHGRGLITDDQQQRMVRLMIALGLCVWHPALERTGILTAALADTTLHRGGRQLIPVPYQEIGAVTFLDDVSSDEIARAVDVMHASQAVTA